MWIPLVVSLVVGQTLPDLKPIAKSSASSAIYGLTDGELYVPGYAYLFKGVTLSGEQKAALLREVMPIIREYVESPQGREQWARQVASEGHGMPDRAASVASNLAYWTTYVKESKAPTDSQRAQLEKASGAAAAFKKDRPRLEKLVALRHEAHETPDDAHFRAQLIERLTWFLEETKAMPWKTAIVERERWKYFADKSLESKPNWWKFFFRGGPEVTDAGREFAQQWLSDLRNPSKLSDEK